MINTRSTLDTECKEDSFKFFQNQRLINCSEKQPIAKNVWGCFLPFLSFFLLFFFSFPLEKAFPVEKLITGNGTQQNARKDKSGTF